MAKARMLHKTISVSTQVNKMTLPAQLLFTWMIPHADDEGRLKGNPQYIKAIVVPMTNWSFNRIKKYLEEMKNYGLIYYWQENNEWHIEFIKWKDHQAIRKDRFTSSKLPSFSNNKVNQTTAENHLEDDQKPAQSNISKENKIQSNKSEGNEFADEKTYNTNSLVIDPSDFTPADAGETAALEAFIALEPDNRKALFTTYLNAYKKGLPVDLFYRFTSEIEQDKTIKNPGAIFNDKVEDYFKKRVRK